MLSPWKKTYDQPRQHIKKQRHYFAEKVKAMLFPVVMYGWDSWTIKKAECQRIELWCWGKLLKLPWTARRSNQWILKEIRPEYSLEGLMLKLKFQYFGHLMQRTDSLEKPWCWERLKAKFMRARTFLAHCCIPIIRHLQKNVLNQYLLNECKDGWINACMNARHCTKLWDMSVTSNFGHLPQRKKLVQRSH